MIDPKELEKVINQEIAKQVETQVFDFIEGTNWTSNIESKLISILSRDLAKQLNVIDIDPLIQKHTKELFNEYAKTIEYNSIDPKELEKVINQEIAKQVETQVFDFVEGTDWTSNIESKLISVLTRDLAKRLNVINISQLIQKHTKELFNEYAKTIEYNGIDDQAKKVELSILEDAVVIENELISNKIKAVKLLTTDGSLIIKKDLVVLGDVNTDATGWDKLASRIQQDVFRQFTTQIKKQLTEDVINLAKTTSIDFKKVTVNGKSIVVGNALSNTITESMLHKVGALKELTVTGQANINDCLHVVNKRIGINTETPSMALTIWDEEAEIVAGKIKKQTAFIGTGRKQELQIGINRSGNITIKDDGLVQIERLQVGLNRISHASELPGYLGSKGDIVFNNNVSKSNLTFAWMCLGNYNWLSLKSS